MLPGFAYKGPDHPPAPPPPAPTVTTANNGTSLSGTAVVLGNDVAAPGDPGALLSDREIQMGGFRLIFLNAAINGLWQIFLNSIDGSSDAGCAVTVNNNITGNVSSIFSDSANNVAGCNFNSCAIKAFLTGGMKIHDSGSLTPNTDPGANVLEIEYADVLLTGRIRSDFFVSPQAASPVAVSATADKDKVFTNTGAAGLVVFNLPAAVVGLRYTFYNQNANNISVDAAAGDTIRVGPLVTAAGAAITSTAIGDTVTLQAINSTEWIAIASIGTFV